MGTNDGAATEVAPLGTKLVADRALLGLLEFCLVAKGLALGLHGVSIIGRRVLAGGWRRIGTHDW
jgi:hypothetical protein